MDESRSRSTTPSSGQDSADSVESHCTPILRYDFVLSRNDPNAPYFKTSDSNNITFQRVDHPLQFSEVASSQAGGARSYRADLIYHDRKFKYKLIALPTACNSQDERRYTSFTRSPVAPVMENFIMDFYMDETPLDDNGNPLLHWKCTDSTQNSGLPITGWAKRFTAAEGSCVRFAVISDQEVESINGHVE
ncbi:hypothetical protein L207DRAFT_536020 [Hyaloscypha variabilis F]|uniref:Uncharacterized protein n=1 Tax=Hyaloscypha variabilis (strain UAMH 11265 / GT02V1 / F) TaxID=1149755 RepID=A0A2J6R2H9_HYAVF|nr:hypothetical protein L207DRAFT_536020 [Hyaloscypha variabilis F]